MCSVNLDCGQAIRNGRSTASVNTSPSPGSGPPSPARHLAAIQSGDPIKGGYKFTDEFPMAEGFEENAEFFTLTYESPITIGHNKAFSRIASLLWMRAGSQGRRVDTVPREGWDVADTYGILFDLDQTTPFCQTVGKAERLRVAYIVTNDDRRFQAVVRRLPDSVEPVRLYESYLANFQFANGD
jgi:adenine-specific DNA-methyltransferase